MSTTRTGGSLPPRRPPSSSRSSASQDLRSRRGAAEDGDRPLERGALDGDGAGVVARVGLLLEGRVVLLVADDQPELRYRREHRRAGADHDPRLARGDSLALVAALGDGQMRVQHGDLLAEALAEATERLRRQRDLGHQHDRALAALERGGASLQVDLGLTAAGRAVEQEGAAAFVERLHDARNGLLLRSVSRSGARSATSASRSSGRARSPRRLGLPAPPAQAPARASSRSRPTTRARARPDPAAASRRRS